MERSTLGRAGNTLSQIAQQTVLETVDPAMQVQVLASRPGLSDDGCPAQRLNLASDIQFAKSGMRIGVAEVLEFLPVLLPEHTSATQPVIHDALGFGAHRSFDT